jgi:hypothetical protein
MATHWKHDNLKILIDFIYFPQFWGFETLQDFFIFKKFDFEFI